MKSFNEFFNDLLSEDFSLKPENMRTYIPRTSGKTASKMRSEIKNKEYAKDLTASNLKKNISDLGDVKAPSSKTNFTKSNKAVYKSIARNKQKGNK